MGGDSGGGGSSTTVQKADPWTGVQPYLTQGYQQLSQLYGGSGPQYYPGATTVAPHWMEQAGIDAQNQATPQINQLGQYGAQNNINMMNTTNQAAGTGYNAAQMGIDGMLGIAQQGASGNAMANNASSALAGYGTGGALSAGTAGTAGAINNLGATSNLTGSGAATAQNAANYLTNFAGGPDLGVGGQASADAVRGLIAAGDPSTNQYVSNAIDSAIRPVTQQFQEQVMPAIKSGAIDAGQMGSSRQGIAEGIAARGYQDTVGDISSNMMNSAYNQGLSAMQAGGQLGQSMVGQALGAGLNAGQLGQNMLNSGIAAAGTSGSLGQGMVNSALGALGQSGSLGAQLGGQAGSLYSGIAGAGNSMLGTGITGMGQASALNQGAQQGLLTGGQVQQQLGQGMTADAQAQRDAEVNRWNYNQNLPYTMIQDYLAALNGAQGGQTTSQQSGGSSNRLTGALGGAATGAALGSVVPGLGTGIGAGVGALYGLFM